MGDIYRSGRVEVAQCASEGLIRTVSVGAIEVGAKDAGPIMSVDGLAKNAESLYHDAVETRDNLRRRIEDLRETNEVRLTQFHEELARVSDELQRTEDLVTRLSPDRDSLAKVPQCNAY